MGRHNEVILNGMVLMPPQFKKNEKGENVRGCVSILVIRGQRDICNNKIKNIKYDAPMVMTENPEILDIMETLKPYMMIECKGVFTTKNISKAKICPHCKEKTSKPGVLSYISPIYFDVRETGLDEMGARALLERKCEISNSITAIGTVVKEPEFYKDENLSAMEYTIAINRKFYVQEDSTMSKTDYPVVKTFGHKAEEDHKRIKVGTELLINGMLQTKEFKNKIQCEHCGEINEFKDTSMEIIPYATEYLKGYYTEEEILEREQKKAASIAESIINS